MNRDDYFFQTTLRLVTHFKQKGRMSVYFKVKRTIDDQSPITKPHLNNR